METSPPRQQTTEYEDRGQLEGREESTQSFCMWCCRLMLYPVRGGTLYLGRRHEGDIRTHRTAAMKREKRQEEEYLLYSQDPEDVCPTCLECYDQHAPRFMTTCGHHFHIHCMYEWLERSNTCPICGSKIENLK